MSLEFDQGVEAAEEGLDRSDNPYDKDELPDEHSNWNDGFDWCTNKGV